MLAVLLFVAVTGIAAASLLAFGAAAHRRQAEVALLDAGQEFANALASYRRMTPAGMPDQPATLGELTRDPRFPGIVRHLRKLYADPVTGTDQWGVYLDPQTGRIAAIHSLSDSPPQKIANFPLRMAALAGKSAYNEWLFSAEQSVRTDPKSAAQRAARGAFSPLELIESQPGTPRSAGPGGNLLSPLELLEP